MFTGLVEEVGCVRDISRTPRAARITIQARRVLQERLLGESIAVNGVCLTTTGYGNDTFTAEVMAETLDKTNLGRLVVGSRVNLERALKLSDRLGGHLVTGHVDATGMVISLERRGIAMEVWISVPEQLEPLIVPQGSVALDGVSLTVARVRAGAFMVSLIPHTREVTSLGDWKTGVLINIETDIIGKYVYNFLKNGISGERGITAGFLRENGFF